MRHDFSAAGYKRARKAFVHKLPPIEPFTHPAAVGPVIRSARGSATQDRPTDRRPLAHTTATHEDGSALQVLHEDRGDRQSRDPVT